jgi:hypothetical protein
MAVTKPFRKTCRQFIDGNYPFSQYLLHRKFAQDPQHYVRAFLLLQQDLIELFAYIEPATVNLQTYSHRVQQLLMRACVEVEANLTAILLENGYKKASDSLTMQDHKLVNNSHRLSAYEARIPGWQGANEIRCPYAGWENGGSLKWYKAYNKSKHNRHEFFHLATFDALVDAMCGLAVLLSAQFHNEDYSPVEKSLTIGSGYSYGTDDGMESAVGGYFRIKFPTDWPVEDRYDFDWSDLKELDDPFDEFDHAASA